MFTCEIREPGDPLWRKFSFQTPEKRDEFMHRRGGQGYEVRPAELTRDDVPPVLRDRLFGAA